MKTDQREVVFKPSIKSLSLVLAPQAITTCTRIELPALPKYVSDGAKNLIDTRESQAFLHGKEEGKVGRVDQLQVNVSGYSFSRTLGSGRAFQTKRAERDSFRDA